MVDINASGATSPRGLRKKYPAAFWALVTVVAIGAFGGVLLLSAGGGSDPDGPVKGAVAPGFEVATLAGGSFSLSEHIGDTGQPVFLNIWASWCLPCREEMPAIDAAAAAHPDVHFIGVVVDDDEAPAREFVEERNIDYQIGVDDDRVVKDRYRVWAMPSTYLIDGDGVIVDAVFGPLDLEDLEILIARLEGGVG
jgi:thiol-disulfide isomerase/thioredoxin